MYRKRTESPLKEDLENGRNELMVNAMVVARLMERCGRGWLLMREAMAEFDLPEPKIENDPVGRTVRVTLRRVP